MDAIDQKSAQRRGPSIEPTSIPTTLIKQLLSGILYGAVYYSQGDPALASSTAPTPDNPYAVAPASLNVISLLYFSVYNLLWCVARFWNMKEGG